MYDEELAFALFELYDNGDESVLNDLLIHLCPLIRKMVKVELSRDNRSEASAAEVTALERVYEALTSAIVPSTHPKVFTKFIKAIVSRAMYSHFARSRCQVFDLGSVGKYLPVATLRSHFDVEVELYHEQVRAAILDEVKSKVRFVGDEHTACMSIVEVELGYKELSPDIIRMRYHLSVRRFRHLVRYVRILIKSSLMKWREYERADSYITPVWTSG